MNKIKHLLFVILIASGNTLAAQNTPGTIDSTFNGTGMVILDNGFLDLYQDVKIQSDGKIIAVGTTYDASYAADFQVTRLLDDGSYDPSFGNNGVFRYHLGYETGAYACEIKDDGKILVSGISMDNFGGFEMLLIRLDENGTLDPAFGEAGVALFDYGPGEDQVYAMTQDIDGRILLAGNIVDEVYNRVPAVVRFNKNGTLDESFGESGVAKVPVVESDNRFTCIGIDPDGKIVAGGHISNGLSWYSLLLARFDNDGVLDSSFGVDGVVNMNLNNVDDKFFDLKINNSGEIMATGFTALAPDYNFHFLLMKFDQNGTLVPAFGNNGMVVLGETSMNVGYAMDILPDDKIVVAGSLGEKAPMDSDWGIWKFNADGSLDDTFGDGGIVTTEVTTEEFDEALGIAVQEDGNLVVAGKFRMDNNINFGVVRYNNDLTVSVSEISQAQEISVIPNPVRKNGNITLSIEVTEPQTISVDVLNIAGSIVMSRSLGYQAEGMHQDNFSLSSDISNGIYFIRVTGSKTAFSTSKIAVVE